MHWLRALRTILGRRVSPHLTVASLAVPVLLAFLAATLPFLLITNLLVRQWVSELLMPVYSLGAAAVLFLTGQKTRRHSSRMGIAWQLLGLAALCTAIGDIAWAIIGSILRWPPFPSLADVFHLLFYPLLLGGILIMPSGQNSPVERLIRLLETTIITLSAALFLWNFLVAPRFAYISTDGWTAVAISLVYPFFDLFALLALLTLAFRSPPSESRRPLAFLGIGLTLLIFGDILFSLQWPNHNDAQVSITYLAWLLSYTFLGLAGIRQYFAGPTAVPDRPPQLFWIDRLLRGYLPAIMLLAAYYLLVQSYRGHLPMSFSSLAIWVSILAVLTVCVQILYGHENQRLHRELEDRVEQRTWALNQITDALRYSERKFRGVVEQAQDGIVLTDEKGIVIEWNQAMENITGLSAWQSLGRPVWEILFTFAPEERKTPEGYIQLETTIRAALTTGQAPWMGQPVETEHLHPNGERRFIETVMFSIPTEGGFMLSSVARDVTNNKQAEESLKLNEMRLNSLLELSQQLYGMSVDDIIQATLEEAIRLTGSLIGYCHFVREDQETIEMVAWSRKTLEICSAVPQNHYPISSAGVWADCARLRRPVVCNDYPRMPNRHDLPSGHAPIWRHISVPVVENNMVRLIMGAGNKASDYDEADVRQLQLVANETWRMVQRKRVEDLLSQSEERFRTIVNNLPGVIYRCEPHRPWRMTYISDEIENLSGYPASDFLEGKRTYEDLLLPEDRGGKYVTERIAAHLPYEIEYRIRRADGKIRWVFERGSAYYSSYGETLWLDGVVLDITHRRALQRELEELAITDSLTGLHNRRHFLERFEEEMKRAQRYHTTFSLLIFDLDRFKLVNDTYGHDAGDIALQRVAATARRGLRQVDSIGRLGGEEFGVLLPNTSLAEAAALAERLRNNIRQIVLTARDGQFSVTVSIGAAQYTPGIPDVDTLMKHADRALYHAKEAGRDCVRVYQPSSL